MLHCRTIWIKEISVISFSIISYIYISIGIIISILCTLYLYLYIESVLCRWTHMQKVKQRLWVVERGCSKNGFGGGVHKSISQITKYSSSSRGQWRHMALCKHGFCPIKAVHVMFSKLASITATQHINAVVTWNKWSLSKGDDLQCDKKKWYS